MPDDQGDTVFAGDVAGTQLLPLQLLWEKVGAVQFQVTVSPT